MPTEPLDNVCRVKNLSSWELKKKKKIRKAGAFHCILPEWDLWRQESTLQGHKLSLWVSLERHRISCQWGCLSWYKSKKVPSCDWMITAISLPGKIWIRQLKESFCKFLYVFLSRERDIYVVLCLFFLCSWLLRPKLWPQISWPPHPISNNIGSSCSWNPVLFPKWISYCPSSSN